MAPNTQSRSEPIGISGYSNPPIVSYWFKAINLAFALISENERESDVNWYNSRTFTPACGRIDLWTDGGVCNLDRAGGEMLAHQTEDQRGWRQLHRARRRKVECTECETGARTARYYTNPQHRENENIWSNYFDWHSLVAPTSRRERETHKYTPARGESETIGSGTKYKSVVW